MSGGGLAWCELFLMKQLDTLVIVLLYDQLK
jgi:hypothetical protein